MATLNLFKKSNRKIYIFSKGGAGRDLKSLIESIRGLDNQIRIITFSLKTLNHHGSLPDNCHVSWRIPLQQSFR